MGMSRVGCMPCIMAKLGEIKQISHRFPEVITNIAEAEKRLDTTFFTNTKIPDRFCSKFKKKPYPIIEDVVNYVQRKDSQEDLFIEDKTEHRCMSFYGICE